ncbi:MAG: YceI family protein [Candidatus Binatia bacterium]
MSIYGFFSLLLPFLLAPSLASAAGELIRFRLQPQESRILTQIPHPFGTVNGEFALREGEANGDIKDLQRSASVRLTMDATSYSSGFGPRDQDVQENYLEADQYPVISFTSKGVETVKQPKSPDEAWEFTIKGVLELHGVERETQVPVKLTQRGKKITVEGGTRILLEHFNIATPSIFFFRAGDSVEVSFRFVGEQQS